MNDYQINLELIKEIKSKTSDSPFRILKDTLALNKEAIYRRLRGEVPFLYSEAVKIAKELNISMDRLNDINPRLDSYRFNTGTPELYATIEGYSDFLSYPDKYHQDLDETKGTFYCVNTDIPFEILGKYEHLSKLRLLKWMYENRGLKVMKLKFAEMQYPEDYAEKANRFLYLLRKNPSHYILSEMMFENYIMEVDYFHKMGFLNTDDIKVIKKDLLNLVDEFEEVATSGKFADADEAYFYLTNRSVRTMFGYFERGDYSVSFNHMFGLNYMFTTSRDVYVMYKKAIEDMKDYTYLISVISSALRRTFMEKQRVLIDKSL